MRSLWSTLVLESLAKLMGSPFLKLSTILLLNRSTLELAMATLKPVELLMLVLLLLRNSEPRITLLILTMFSLLSEHLELSTTLSLSYASVELKFWYPDLDSLFTNPSVKTLESLGDITTSSLKTTGRLISKRWRPLLSLILKLSLLTIHLTLVVLASLETTWWLFSQLLMNTESLLSVMKCTMDYLTMKLDHLFLSAPSQRLFLWSVLVLYPRSTAFLDGDAVGLLFTTTVITSIKLLITLENTLWFYFTLPLWSKHLYPKS